MKFLKPFYENKYQDKDLPFAEFYKEHKKELESMGVSEEDISESRNGSFNIKIDTERFDIPESYIISKQLIVVRSWEGWANYEGVVKNIIPNKLPEYSEEFF